MRMKKLSIWLSLAMLLVGGVAVAETFPLDLEIGYRWLDVEGNEDLYRTQINEQDGFLIRSLTLYTNDFNGSAAGAMDHFRIDVSDLGAGPAGALRMEFGRADLYNLRIGYRQAEQYSALPQYANPLFSRGIIPGQHTWDRDRTMLDADIEFLPGRRFTPFVGFSQSTNDGPGTTTYSVGLDEFRLDSDLDETDREIRAGVAFNAGRFYGAVTQGWRTLSSDETLTLAAGEGSGNNLGTILGRPITASELTRNSETDIDTPFTNAFVTGEISSRIRLIGNYSRANAENEGVEFEDVTGSFASFGLARFFTGLEENVNAKADNETWRGGARAEFDITDKITLLAGYSADHRELEGSSLINSLYRDTINFGGVDPRDIAEVLESNNSLERDENVLRATLSGRSFGPFSFRAGYSQTAQELTVAPDLSEIVLPQNQGGNFERTIDAIDLVGNYSKAGFTLGAAIRLEDADEAVLRTDFETRDRSRIRAAYRTPNNFFRAGITAEETNSANDRNGIGYDGEFRQFTGDFEIAPISMLRVRASYSQHQANSTILIQRPEDFSIVPSVNDEDGDAIEGGISLFVNRFGLDADAARFENEGTLPFSFDRFRVRFLANVFPHAGITAEWSRDKFDQDEDATTFADYDADRIGVYLRWRP